MLKQSASLFAGILTLLFLAGCTAAPTLNGKGPSSSAPDAEATAVPLDQLPLYDAETANSEIESALVSRYYGSCQIVEGAEQILRTYDISTVYHKPQDFEIILDIYEYNSTDRIQSLSYNTDLCDLPRTIEQGLLVADFNGSGADGFLMDLGIIGHRKSSACFVYSPEERAYILVPGFDELWSPVYMQEQGLFRTELDSYLVEAPYHGGWEKYKIDGTELVLVERLLHTYLGEGEGYRYTLERFNNAEKVVIKEQVPENEIDFSDWGFGG